MRKLLFFGLTTLSITAMGQSIEEAKQLLYYDRYQSAEQVLQQVIQQKDDEKQAYYWLTEVYLENDDIEKAKSLLEPNAESLAAAHPLNRVAYGSLLLNQDKLTEARAQFDAALKESKRKDEAVIKAVAKAQVENEKGDAAYALQVLNEIKEKKIDAEVLSIKGDAYRKLGQGSESAKAYMEALIKNDKYAEAAFKLGKIYLTQQNTEMFLKYFNQAIEADPKYAAAYYELYYYYYFRDVNKAKEYLDLYVANTDKTVEHQYMTTDLMFASSKYPEAISGANAILQQEGEKTKPRLYKLLAYSYDASGDSTKALEYLQTYFNKEVDSNLVAKDYDLQAKLLTKTGNDSLALQSWERAIAMDTVTEYKLEYMQQLANWYKEKENRSGEARWLGKIFETKEDPNNLDIYNWGLAHYAAAEYNAADSVFGLYTAKYPDQVYGFYWRAKSRAQIDTTMEQGLAVQDYLKVIEIAEKDVEKNKSLLLQAYGYLGAYEANVKKDYPAALGWFEKILAVQPDNADAERFAGILKKWISDGGPK
ncbi:tetratricopeptide repeat protein [Flavihumibacter sp.]|uniref:tetratricopeptide repeat protein n=1 Tax=Flavihumibacter sp. TaxID=1913981 RepID=UPI002FC6BE3D